MANNKRSLSLPSTKNGKEASYYDELLATIQYAHWGHHFVIIDEALSIVKNLKNKLANDTMRCQWAGKTVLHSQLDLSEIESYIEVADWIIKWTKETDQQIVFEILPIISYNVMKNAKDLKNRIESKLQYDYPESNEK